MAASRAALVSPFVRACCGRSRFARLVSRSMLFAVNITCTRVRVYVYECTCLYVKRVGFRPPFLPPVLPSEVSASVWQCLLACNTFGY